ncbi:MAG: PAS domain-containing sensor histidine kinase [Cyclobacteriaceae bacterium]
MQNASLPEKDPAGENSFLSRVEAFRFQESVLNASGLAIMSTTPEGIITGLNTAAEKLLGYLAKDYVGKPWLHFHDSPELLKRAEEAQQISGTKMEPTFAVIVSEALRQKSGAHPDWTLIRKDGSRIPVSLAVIPLHSEDDLLSGFAGIITDLTGQQMLKNILDSKSDLESLTLQLREQNRRLDEFAHIISHNLRAPVNNIQALINLLNNNSEIADYKLIFDKLKNVSKNLNETMNELMDTLKAKTEPQVDVTEIRFKEVLDKVVQSLEGELIVAQASVTFDFNEAPLILYSKPYLESIFQNLLTNAIKYRSPHRTATIHFKTFMRDNHLELSVSDNGQGIDLDRFGDKLFGLHKTFHEHQEARGVGLFLIKTQVEAMGGSISVKSEVDKGTTFTIRFN